MSTQVTTGYNPAHPIGTCAKCSGEMIYNVPRLGPNGGYVHKGTGRVECGIDLGEGYRRLHNGEFPLATDEVWINGNGPWKAYDAMPESYFMLSIPISDAHHPVRRRIEQPSKQPETPLVLPAWEGSVEDDCYLTAGEFRAHVKQMDDWCHLDVRKGCEFLFDAIEYTGCITGMDLARALGEAIIRGYLGK